MRTIVRQASKRWLMVRFARLFLTLACLLAGAVGGRANRSEAFEPSVPSASAGQADRGQRAPDSVLGADKNSRIEPNSARPTADAFRIGREGVRIRSGGGVFDAEMHVRSQIRFSTPFPTELRQKGDFFHANERAFRFRRARFKTQGQILRPWIRFATEYDLVGTRVLDASMTVQKWDWLQFRFGQWKTEFGREWVDSSGQQEFAERSIVNRQFTVDRQKGFQALGRVMKGTLADSRYHAGVFTGNGRGLGLRGGGRLDNRDGSPMWAARYQWNFLREDPGFSQTDIEYHESPVAAVAVSALSNRGRFTRFSPSGGGQLDGFEVGLPGQFAVKQVAEDFVLKYRGFFLQHEFHWKNVRDHVQQRITRMRGGRRAGRVLSASSGFMGPEAIGARHAARHGLP